MKKLIVLFTLITASLSYAQTIGSVVGKLTDKEYNNEPLAFANVLIKGTITGTTSDFDGLYSLDDLEAGEYTIVFSFVGYATSEVTVANETVINVSLTEDAALLDEIVITGYRKQTS